MVPLAFVLVGIADPSNVYRQSSIVSGSENSRLPETCALYDGKQVTFEIDSTERSIDARAATVMNTVTMNSIPYFGAKPNIPIRPS